MIQIYALFFRAIQICTPIKIAIQGLKAVPVGRKLWFALTLLKSKIANTPILKHFDPDRILVVVVYASKWAVSLDFLQEHDGTYWPVTFTNRTLKPNEISYRMVEKDVLTLLRISDLCCSMLVSRETKAYRGYLTLAWLVQSYDQNGRLGRYNWALEGSRCEKGDNEILVTLAELY